MKWISTWQHLLKHTYVSVDSPFLCRCNISQPYMSGFQSRLLSKRLFAPILLCYCAKRKVSTLKCLSFSSWCEGSVWTRRSKLLTRRRSAASLFIVSLEVAKPFAKQLGQCRQYLQAPEEVITIGMNSSKLCKIDRKVTGREDKRRRGRNL